MTTSRKRHDNPDDAQTPHPTPTSLPAAVPVEHLAARLDRLEEALRDHSTRLDEVFRVGETGGLLVGLAAAHAQLEQELKAWETARRQDMEARAAEARTSWDVERRRFREAFEEEKSRVTREWEREREELEQTTRSRKARLDTELRALTAEREQALAGKERAVEEARRELEELRRQVKRFPAELTAAVERARGEALAGARAQLAAAAKDADVTRAVLEERVAEAQRLTAQQAARIGELEHDLRDAMAKLREIAISTVQGVSALVSAPPPVPKATSSRKSRS